MLTTGPRSVIPYQLPVAKENASDISGTLGSTLPMAAMFTRNKFIGWCGTLRAMKQGRTTADFVQGFCCLCDSELAW